MYRLCKWPARSLLRIVVVIYLSSVDNKILVSNLSAILWSPFAICSLFSQFLFLSLFDYNAYTFTESIPTLSIDGSICKSYFSLSNTPHAHTRTHTHMRRERGRQRQTDIRTRIISSECIILLAL